MTDNYKELKEIWYRKLKDSGFKDIEQENGMLDNRPNKVIKDKAIKYKELRNEYASYFSAIGYFFYNYKPLPRNFIKYDRVVDEFIKTGNLLGAVKNNQKYYNCSAKQISVSLTRTIKQNLNRIIAYYNEAIE